MTTEAAAQQTIVVGVDGSEASKEALRWAAAQAALSGSRLRAVLSWHVPVMAYGTVMPLPLDTDVETESRTVLGEAITAALGDHPGVEVSAEVVEGFPALQLLEAARGADLLVVGSRGHGAFTGMLLGSVSEHCISHATCPVVVVRATADGDAA